MATYRQHLKIVWRDNSIVEDQWGRKNQSEKEQIKGQVSQEKKHSINIISKYELIMRITLVSMIDAGHR